MRSRPRQAVREALLAAAGIAHESGLARSRAFRELGYFVFEQLGPAEATRVRTSLGFDMWVDPTSPSGRQIVRTGLHEKDTTRFLQKTLSPGQVVLDIGANAGYFTLLASSLVKDQGKVYAFEPMPYNYQLLVRNVTENGIGNVRCERMAVTNSVGRSPLFINPMHGGSHSLLLVLTARKHVVVDTTTVDEYLAANNLTVDVIKMDIEGAELFALEGMKQTIRQAHKLTILFEFNPDVLERLGIDPTGLIRKLAAEGLRISSIREDGSTQAVSPEDWRLCDLSSLLVADKG